MRLLGFPISGNNLYIEIVQLYSEILCIGLVILYIIAECIAIVLYNFSIEKSNFSYNYSSKLEGMLDIAFILFPTFIIIYVLIPSLGFLYHTEDSLEHLFYSFTLDVIGHQ